MPTVTVRINGKNYRMACENGQEDHLERLAKSFDGYVDSLKGEFGEIGDQRLTVMAGVMVTDEMLELKKTVERLTKEVEELSETRLIQSREKQRGDGELADGLDRLAQRVEALSQKLATT